MSAYAASKAAAEAMCDSWRIELAHHGVAVTCCTVVGDDADGRTGPGQQRLRAVCARA
jgi:NAD(P)-dependent dehydrogenase (short-subunit alcohol dehydrogenase family)